MFLNEVIYYNTFHNEVVYLVIANLYPLTELTYRYYKSINVSTVWMPMNDSIIHIRIQKSAKYTFPDINNGWNTVNEACKPLEAWLTENGLERILNSSEIIGSSLNARYDNSFTTGYGLSSSETALFREQPGVYVDSPERTIKFALSPKLIKLMIPLREHWLPV